MLGGVLVLLLIACEIVSPGYLSGDRMGTILRFAAPLAILAAGQTLVMLTAGIDLSVAATATAAAYIMAGQASRGTTTALADRAPRRPGRSASSTASASASSASTR